MDKDKSYKRTSGALDELLGKGMSNTHSRTLHELKTWPVAFQPLIDGKKNFEYRKNDRNFKVGDYLYLREFNPEKAQYTGRHCHAEVEYILDGSVFPVKKGYVIMSIRVYDIMDKIEI